jgi:hypothetical protein
LPAIPSGASYLTIIGNEFTLCSTDDQQNNGIKGNGSVVAAYPSDEQFGTDSYNYGPSVCLELFQNVTFQNNVWVSLGVTNSYVLYSSDYTLQQLIDYFLSDYSEDLEIVGTLSKPISTNITEDSITIESTKNITAGNNILYIFFYTTDLDDPYMFSEEVTPSGNVLSATITGLTLGVTYYFTESAYNITNYVDSEISDGYVPSA